MYIYIYIYICIYTYVYCQVNDRGDTAVRTRHLTQTLEPVWNETFEIAGYRRGEVLELLLWSRNEIGGDDDCVGHYTMDAPFFLQHGFVDGEVQLELELDGKSYALPAFLTLKAEVVEIPPHPALPRVQAGDVQFVLGDIIIIIIIIVIIVIIVIINIIIC